MTVTIESPRRPFRAEDLLEAGMPEKFVEVIEGELVMMTPAGWEHNRIASEFEFLFRHFCQSRPDLDYGGDNDGFLLQRDPDVLLSPDASLFRSGKQTPGSPWMEFAPEVVVEVISPGNNPAEIAYKRRKYFEAGAEQVWLAHPAAETLEIEFRDGRRVIAQGSEVVEAEGIAQGLKIDLRQIFAVKQRT
jgi:Uma2 family endonuclease